MRRHGYLTQSHRWAHVSAEAARRSGARRREGCAFIPVVRARRAGEPQNSYPPSAEDRPLKAGTILTPDAVRAKHHRLSDFRIRPTAPATDSRKPPTPSQQGPSGRRHPRDHHRPSASGFRLTVHGQPTSRPLPHSASQTPSHITVQTLRCRLLRGILHQVIPPMRDALHHPIRLRYLACAMSRQVVLDPLSVAPLISPRIGDHPIRY
jgi:hypothetical protein